MKFGGDTISDKQSNLLQKICICCVLKRFNWQNIKSLFFSLFKKKANVQNLWPRDSVPIIRTKIQRYDSTYLIRISYLNAVSNPSYLGIGLSFGSDISGKEIGLNGKKN